MIFSAANIFEIEIELSHLLLEVKLSFKSVVLEKIA